MSKFNADNAAFSNDEILAKASAPDRVRLMHLAEGLTLGDRNKDYGDPYPNQQSQADAFNALTGRDLTAAEISLVYIVGKLSRIRTSPLKEDNYVDAIAYAGIMYECAKAQAEN